MATNPQQVKAQYAALPWYKQLGVAADDLARIGANALTFGLADRLAAATGEQNTAQRTEEAKIRAGLAGDVTGALGSLAGGAGAIKGAAAASKVLPTIAKAALANKGKIGAGVLGAGVAADNYLTRTGAELPTLASQNSSPVPAKATSAPVAKQTAAPAKTQGPKTIDDVIANIIGQSGTLSLNQLGALAQAQGQAAQGRGSPVKPRDAILQQLATLQDAAFQQRFAAADSAPDPELARQSAVDDYMQRRMQLIGVDPLLLPTIDEGN